MAVTPTVYFGTLAEEFKEEKKRWYSIGTRAIRSTTYTRSKSEQLPLGPATVGRRRRALVLVLVEALQRSQLVHRLAQSVSLLLQIEVFTHRGVLPREFHQVLPAQVVDQACVDLAGELVEELREQLDVDEHDGSVGELVGDDIEEGLGTEGLGLGAGLAAASLQSLDPQLQNVRSLLEEACLACLDEQCRIVIGAQGIRLVVVTIRDPR